MRRLDEKKLIDDLITDHMIYGYTSFDALTSDDQRELVGAYMLSKDRDEAWELLTEHNEVYLPFYIGIALMDGDSLQLMSQLTDAIKPYVKDNIQKLLDLAVAQEPQRLKAAFVDQQISEGVTL
ncbi:hypothetical protein KAR91_39045 [Candidatus Pacearchaeota archaeon]|nr:hypothetical protein [Candidatus Pacearchaeota archaeon]